jgi:hypothetical protein
MKAVAMLFLAAWVAWMWSAERSRWEPIEEFRTLEACRAIPEMFERTLQAAPPLETIEDPEQRRKAGDMREVMEATLAGTQCLPAGVAPTTPPMQKKTTPRPVRPSF